MRAASLLRLYPAAWRRRYGAEFLEMVGEAPLDPLQAIDIIRGALDAWLSADIRRGLAARAAAPATGGSNVRSSVDECAGRGHYRPLDAFLGAALIVGGSAFFSLAGLMAHRAGHDGLRQFLGSLAFPASLMLSLPFWLMKGVPARVQALVIGITLVLVAAIGLLAVVN